MIARVSLEIALRKEFDYSVPPELTRQVDVGSRVQVPFGPRKVLGVVTAVAEESAQIKLKAIIKVIGEQTLVTPKVLKLARWIGEYYCCAPETALKSVLPEAVRKEDASWRERLFVRALPQAGALPPLSKRQQAVWQLVEERREILLSELVELAATTAATVRKLEDRGLVLITSEIAERDPYAKETILATEPLVMNPAQAAALEKIKAAMQRAADVSSAEPPPAMPASANPGLAVPAMPCRQDAGSTFAAQRVADVPSAEPPPAMPASANPGLAVPAMPCRQDAGSTFAAQRVADVSSAEPPPAMPASANPGLAVPAMPCRQDAGSTFAAQRVADVSSAEPPPATTVPSKLGYAALAIPYRHPTGSTLTEPVSPFFNKEAGAQKYSGWLPHWRQSEKMYFVTFRLNDSVAQDQLRAWSAEKEIWQTHHPKPWDEKTWTEYHRRFTSEMERWLDNGHGSCVLRRPEIGKVVATALHHFDDQRYQLGEYVIMPNHVHVLVRPAENQSLESILHSWKSFTAKQANALLNTAGTFWREEYFDHLVRSAAHYEKFSAYILENPQKAKLSATACRLGKGTFDLQAALAGEKPTSRQDAGSTAAGQCAADVPSAEAPPAMAAPANPVHAVPAPPCRQDAGSTFLLHGVTGSGKTEVYLQAIAHALAQGKGAIVLVPEIALTPQTVERFKARFSSGKLQTLVAVLHSHLSAGERHDEWHKIRQGRARIVIGARSAIFAPVEPLGLIIVDEEHEHTYKQEEAPRYHARDVAVMRGQMEQAVVVLGSATPSLESYANCKKGKFTLLELPERVDDQKMPYVRVVDMRQAQRGDKGIPIFSPQLKEAITQRLERGEQTILFLNRRGYSSSFQCPKCGFVAECPNCSVSLTYHRHDQKLACHICGHTEIVPKVCPEKTCRNPEIRYAGVGTQKVEDTLGKLFPQARVRRMDADTMKRKDDYRATLGDFRAGKIDILVGTQMIAKGLHFPNVTLVGIIYADMALHQPDFRAGERTFQLLTQVAGRAGRGDVEGEVFVQAFTPFHPAIQYARRHDFVGFYEQELEFREQLKYPPFSRVALLTLKGRNEDKVKFSADHLRRELEKLLKPAPAGAGASGTPSLFGNAGASAASGSPPPEDVFRDLVIAGPAPAPLLRAENYYRHQIMLRTGAMSRLSRELARLVQTITFPDDVTMLVDIDPVDLG